MTHHRVMICALGISALLSAPVGAFTPGVAETMLVNTGNAAAKRAAVINAIWGQQTLPTLPAYLIQANVLDPITNVTLQNLQHVDLLGVQTTYSTHASVSGQAYFFTPAGFANGRVAIMHMGHGCVNFNDSAADNGYFGYARTVKALLNDGFAVAMVAMPGVIDGNCGGGLDVSTNFHDTLFSPPYVASPGSPNGLRFFLDPTLQVINYVNGGCVQNGSQTCASYVGAEFDMTGLSGGGWTTAVYPALDERVRNSVQVSGSLPFDWVVGGRDTEQLLSGLDGIIGGYKDLYFLGGFDGNSHRHHTQVLNRYDDCCFSHTTWGTGNNLRPYETAVRNALAQSGAFRIEINETTTVHTISQYIVNMIADEFAGALPHYGAALVGNGGPPQVFAARGQNGNLTSNEGGGWSDSGLMMAGAPAVAGAPNTCWVYSVFYRDGDNHLQFGARGVFGIGQIADLSGAPIAGDVSAVVWGTSNYDVVGMRAPNSAADEQLYHWYSRDCGNTWTTEVLTQSQQAAWQPIGTPATVNSDAHPFLDIFWRGKANGDLKHFGASQYETLASSIRGEPSAIRYSTSYLGAYVLAQDYSLMQYWGSNGAWGTYNLSTQTGANTPLSGSPSVSLASGNIRVWSRSRDAGNLTLFYWPQTGWSFSNKGGAMVGTPTALGAVGAYMRYLNGWTYLHDGTNWTWLAGYVNR